MKRWMSAGAVATALVALALAEDTEKPKEDVRAVQVREAILRDKPSFLGKVVARLKYETLVAVEERKDSRWLRVRAVKGGDTGWLAETAVATDAAKLKAASGQGEEGAGETSRSLAGRGFDDKVEARRRARLEGTDLADGYRRLDELLKKPEYNADPAEVPAFVEAGAK